MLQLQSKQLDICRIGKLLAKHNVNASITNKVINLYGEVSDDLLNQLYNSITICTVQNFSGEIPSIVQNESSFSNVDEPVSRKMR